MRVKAEMDTGVVDTPIEGDGVTTGDSPSQGIESGSTQEVEAGAVQETTEETLPFANHPKYLEALKGSTDAQAQIAEMKEMVAAAEKAMAWQEWLNKDPQEAAAFLNRKLGIKTVEVPETDANAPDPYADYEPDVAEKFREYDAIVAEWKKMKAQSEENQTRHQRQRIEDNRMMIDEAFDELAIEAGIMDKEGKGNDQEIDFIANAVLAKVHAIAKNPRMPTKTELNEAWKMLQPGINAVKKRGLTTNTRAVPPSGSRTGSAPAIQKEELTEEQRINEIASMFG